MTDKPPRYASWTAGKLPLPELGELKRRGGDGPEVTPLLWTTREAGTVSSEALMEGRMARRDRPPKRERRNEEYEKRAWWDFIGAEHRSPAYQKLLAHGITRSLVAAKAHSASTKTIGNIFVQLLFDILTPGPSTDRVEAEGSRR